MVHEFILAGHAVSTVAMLGVIWFVQVVHYPMFPLVGENRFREYETVHQQLTTRVVAPLMLTELATAGLLVFVRPDSIGLAETVVGLTLVAVIWLSTWLWQVPAHQQLQSSFDPAVHRRLCRTNWVRTVAWTVRSGLAVAWCLR